MLPTRISTDLERPGFCRATLSAHPMPTVRAPSKTQHRLLRSPGWNPNTRQALESLIRTGAGQGLPVVFDFDNTLVCGDIGEAALAVLARSSVLTPSRINPALCPPLKTPGGNRVTIESCREITEYYEAFLAPTI